jgi:hypothetical protein
MNISLKDNLSIDNKLTKNTYYETENNLNFKSTNSTDNLKVVIRIRPPLQREIEENLPFRSIVRINIFNIYIK